jgi:hypothetical protein
MSSWFYGLVRESNGKIRLWEIHQESNSFWGYRAVTSWAIEDIRIVIKDLLNQKRKLNCLWDGKKLEEGTKKQFAIWDKQIKKIDLRKAI